MKALATATLTALTVAACGGGGGGADPAAIVTVAVFRTLGSTQCTGGGTSADTLQNLLVNAGVEVVAASCGVDGVFRAPVCGTSDGRIGVFDVAQEHVSLATALGFSLLTTLPDAQRQPCGN
jgi:hypothetical protein